MPKQICQIWWKLGVHIEILGLGSNSVWRQPLKLFFKTQIANRHNFPVGWLFPFFAASMWRLNCMVFLLFCFLADLLLTHQKLCWSWWELKLFFNIIIFIAISFLISVHDFFKFYHYIYCSVFNGWGLNPLKPSFTYVPTL